MKSPSILIALICLNAIASWSQAIDLAAFDKLDKDKKLSFVLDGLREREAALQNLSLVLDETVTNSPPNGPEFKENRQISLKTVGHKYNIEVATKLSGESGKNLNEIVRESWDGQTSLYWRRFEANPRATGFISGSESSDRVLDNAWWYTEHLGTRRENPSTRYLADWIDFLVSERKLGFEASSTNNAGVSTLRFVLTSSSGNRYEFVLDPSRGFAIQEYALFLPGRDSTVYKFAETKTDEMRQIDSVFIPWKVTRTVYGSDAKKLSVATYAVSEASLGKLTEKDLPIAFEPNTLVADEVKQAAYEILIDGTKVSRPYTK